MSFAVGHSAGSKIASIVPKRKEAHTLLGTFDSGEQIVNTAFAALSKIIKLHIITFSVSIFCEDLLLCAQGQGREGKSKLDICSIAIIFFYARLHRGQKWKNHAMLHRLTVASQNIISLHKKHRGSYWEQCN